MWNSTERYRNGRISEDQNKQENQIAHRLTQIRMTSTDLRIEYEGITEETI